MYILANRQYFPLFIRRTDKKQTDRALVGIIAHCICPIHYIILVHFKQIVLLNYLFMNTRIRVWENECSWFFFFYQLNFQQFQAILGSKSDIRDSKFHHLTQGYIEGDYMGRVNMDYFTFKIGIYKYVVPQPLFYIIVWIPVSENTVMRILLWSRSVISWLIQSPVFIFSQ